MEQILIDYNITGPINKFVRSSCPKKKKHKNKMSGNMPLIKVETEESSRPKINIRNPISINDVDVIRDSDSEGSVATAQPEQTISSPVKSSKKEKAKKERLPSKYDIDPDEYQYFINQQKKNAKVNDDEDTASESESSCSSSGGSASSKSSRASSNASSVPPKMSSGEIERRKQELLIRLMALEKKGVELTKKFSMKSSLKDIEFEYEMHRKQAESEASIHFQQKILMAAVTGLEFLNNKFDPVNAKLDGWSESVMDNITDYDEIFRKLYEKYKTRAQLAPELQLLVTLGGSAFMFHLTQTLFKTAIPGINDVLAKNPDIMNSISSAMSQSLNPIKMESQKQQEISGPNINLSSVINDTKDTDRFSIASSSTLSTAKEVTISNGKKIVEI